MPNFSLSASAGGALIGFLLVVGVLALTHFFSATVSVG